MIADDLKYGWRQLIKAPGFSITAILTLGLAIGANTAVFSLVDAVLLKSIPYPQPERLATMGAIYTRDGAEIRRGSMALTGAGWEALKKQASSVDAALYSGLTSPVSLVASDAHDQCRAAARQRRLLPGARRAAGDRPRIHCRRRRGRRPDARDSERSPLALGVQRRSGGGRAEHPDQSGAARRDRRDAAQPSAATSMRICGRRCGPRRTGEGGGTNYGVVARLKDGVTWPQAAGEAGGGRRFDDAAADLGWTA